MSKDHHQANLECIEIETIQVSNSYVFRGNLVNSKSLISDSSELATAIRTACANG